VQAERGIRDPVGECRPRCPHCHHPQALDLDGTTKSTKTKNTRRVDLSARLCAALDGAQLAREAEALASGREANALVFPSVFGTPLDIDNVAKIFKRLLVRTGLPKFSLYSLRHSWASHALAAGAPITLVSHNLGHATPAITLSTYSHFLPADSHGFADRLEQWRVAVAPGVYSAR